MYANFSMLSVFFIPHLQNLPGLSKQHSHFNVVKINRPPVTDLINKKNREYRKKEEEILSVK